MSYDTGEHERLIANLIRIGIITEIDLPNARVTVDAGGVPSDWLPWRETRAGATRTWSPPTVGEQVIVLAPYGDMGQAVVLTGIYQDAYPAPSSSGTVDLTTYADGSSVSYDSTAHLLTVNVAASGNVVVNCANATVNATTQATINTPTTTITGNAHVEGNLQIDGTTTTAGLLTYQAGIAGAAGTGTNAIHGAFTVTGGDVVVDGIGVKAHHHTAQGANAATTAAQA